MLRLNDDLKIILFTGDTDFRLGINGLQNLVYGNYGRNNLENTLFVFCSKSKKQVKILEFTNTGIWLYQNKLLRFKFNYPNYNGNIEISKDEFNSLFEVINIMIKGVSETNKTVYKY